MDREINNHPGAEAARALGASDLRIMWEHILPNLVGPLIVYGTLIIPVNILLEASLSYLGLGLPPPTATWGQMLADGQEYYSTAPWMIAVPGLALFSAAGTTRLRTSNAS